MSLNQRQTILKLLLPALALGIVYVYLLARPLNQKIQELKDAVAAAEKAAPKPLAEAQLLSKLKQTKQEVERLKASRKIVIDPAKGAVEVDRAEYGKRLTAALDKYQLHLIAETAESAPGPLPPGLAPPAGKTPAATDPARLEGGARSIRFTGRYRDVLSALKELDGPEHHALPLRISMNRAEEGSKALVWTLVIWL